MNGKIFGALIAASLTALTWGTSTQAQTGRALKIVVPFSPGGSADTLGRLLAEQIGKAHGVATLVENRPGAGTVIATEAVSRAAPDGATVLLAGNSFIINAHLRKLSYDPLTSFEPVCQLVSSPQVIVVNEASPYPGFAQFIDAARAKPGELTMASVGPATTQHMGIEMLKHAADLNIIYVPFPGGAPAVNALLGSHVNSVLGNYSEVVEQLNAGKLRALATTSPARIDLLPNVPAVAEFGYANYEAVVWFGIVAPAKTPATTLSELGAWFGAALQAPEVKPKLLTLGLFPVDKCGSAFAAHLRKQFDDYGDAIRAADIKAE